MQARSWLHFRSSLLSTGLRLLSPASVPNGTKITIRSPKGSGIWPLPPHCKASWSPGNAGLPTDRGPLSEACSVQALLTAAVALRPGTLRAHGDQPTLLRRQACACAVGSAEAGPRPGSCGPIPVSAWAPLSTSPALGPTPGQTQDPGPGSPGGSGSENRDLPGSPRLGVGGGRSAGEAGLFGPHLAYSGPKPWLSKLMVTKRRVWHRQLPATKS